MATRTDLIDCYCDPAYGSCGERCENPLPEGAEQYQGPRGRMTASYVSGQ